MAELTLEQKRAIAVARARQRAAQAQQAAPVEPATPEAPSAPERSFLDRAGQFGAGVIDGTKALIGAAPFGVPGVNRLMMENAGRTAESLGEPADETERRLRTAGEYIGPSVPFGLGGVASSLLSGGVAGQVREMGGGPVAETIATLLAGGAGVGVANRIAKSRQAGRILDAVPSVASLKGQAGALYDAGEATGQTAARGYTRRFADEMTKIATDEGMVLPSGEMMGTYPKVTAALRMVGEYGGEKMAPDQMRQVRRVIQDAAQSADASEARIGAKMLRQFDQFVDPLVPEFGQANKTYARAMRGKEIETATEIATEGRRSSTAAAISNEFQNLTRKGIRGDLTYPPELEAAVRQAANGSRTRRVAEGIGNLAPTPNNVVRSGLGLGTAATAGGALGGPMGAAAVAGGGAGAGLIAKLLATNLAKHDAKLASAIARNGGPLAQAQTPDAIKAAIAALLASQATGPSQGQ